MTRLGDKYKKEVVAKLQSQFGYQNVNQIPKIEKVVLNMGVGEVVQNPKAIENAANDLMLIAGQKPTIRKSKKAIANFKLRKGLPIGAAVTLRGERMFEFLDRFISIALPRVRDFRGIPKNSFDGQGNYSVGLPEQTIFPEIDIEKTTAHGLSITVVTSAKTDAEGKALLEGIGFPFRS